MLNERLCNDCLVREVIPRELYARRSACYDSALIRQRTFVSFLENLDAQVAERALDGFEVVSERLEQCQQEAVVAVFGSGDGSDEQEAAAKLADEKIIEMRLAIKLGKLERALRAGEGAREAALSSGNPEIVAASVFGIGRTQMYMGRNDDAIESMNDAIRRYEEDDNALRVGDVLIWRGQVQMNRGDHEAAQADWEKARDLIIQEGGKEHPLYRVVLNNLATVWSTRGDYERALALHLESLEIRKRQDGDESEAVAVALLDVSYVQIRLGRYDDALEAAERAIAIAEKVSEKDGLLMHAAIGTLGMALKYTGDYRGALEAYERAYEIELRIWGPESTQVAASLDALGLVRAKLGQYDEALRLQERGLALTKKLFGEDHVRVGSALNNMGVTLYEAGRYQEALERFEQALAIREKQLADDHPDLGITRGWIAKCRKKLSSG
jgi:tetratricopeptide (TPR) repeat protein